MRKLLLSLLLSLACLSGWSQTLVGNQLPITVKIAAYGATQNALLSLPDDYNSVFSTGSYPLIIFLHGAGEIGNNIDSLYKLNRQGLPLVISKGTKIQATSPTDGKLYKFIVVSPQHHGWTTEPAAIEYMLGELAKSYRIDANRIYITGLSAGGQGVIQAATYSQALTSRIAAIVPMSPSAPEDAVLKKFTFFAQSKTAAWFFSGNTDPGNYTANAKRYNDSINKYDPGASKLTLFPGGHCCWPTYYNPSFRENGMNVYEWMLTHVKGGGDTVPPTPPVPDHEICIGQANSIRKIIVLMKDGGYREYDSTFLSIPKIQIELQ